MCLCMYVAMSENRFLRFSPFILFRVSHSMKCQDIMGRPFALERGAWHILSQCDPMWVQDKGQEQVQQISSRSTDCIVAGPRIDLMSTTMYIVKGFGLIKRGMRVKRKCNHFKFNQDFSSKAACHKKKKTYLSCLSCQNHFMFLNRG